MKGLTDKQKQILSYISDYIKSNSYPPTLSDIASNFYFSKFAAVCHLNALEKKGYLYRGKKTARALKILKN